jgi:hypothetical protein
VGSLTGRYKTLPRVFSGFWVGLLAVLWSGYAHGQMGPAPSISRSPPVGPCPAAGDLPINASSAELQSLQVSLSLRLDCRDHANASVASSFLALQGAVLRRLGSFEQAILILERALMLDPDRADALLDFALAKDAIGDRSTALAIYRQMLASMDPPALVRSLLQSRIEALKPPIDATIAGLTNPYAPELRAHLQVRQSLGFGLGYDHNINAAISADRLRLTLAEGPIELALAESEQRRSALLSQIEHRLQAQWALPKGDLRWQHRIAHRQPFGATDLKSSQLEAELSWAPYDERATAMAATGFGVLSPRYAVSAQQIFYGSDPLLQSLRVQTLLQGSARSLANAWHVEHCALQATLEAEQKHYPQRSILNGLAGTLGLKLLCDNNGLQWQMQLRAARDWPEGLRPGGIQQRTDLAVGLQLGGGLGIAGYQSRRVNNQLQLVASRVNDEKGYNPLIENNLTRNLDRIALVFERSEGVGINWTLIQLLEAYKQVSNLALFSLQGWTLALQLRRQW